MSKRVKIKATKPLAGHFKLPYGPGHVFELEEKKAKEIIDAGFAEKTTEALTAKALPKAYASVKRANEKKASAKQDKQLEAVTAELESEKAAHEETKQQLEAANNKIKELTPDPAPETKTGAADAAQPAADKK